MLASRAPFVSSTTRGGARPAPHCNVSQFNLASRAAPSASPASARSAIFACCATEDRPVSDENRARSIRRSSGVYWSSTARMAALAHRSTATAWNSSSAAMAPATSPAPSAAANRWLAVAHGRDVFGPHRWDGLADGEFVHRRGDRLRVLAAAHVQWADHGVLPRSGPDQARRFQTGQRLADRRPAHPQPRGQFRVHQPLLRLQGSVHDRGPDRGERIVAEQLTSWRDHLPWHRHAIWCAQRHARCQVGARRRQAAELVGSLRLAVRFSCDILRIATDRRMTGTACPSRISTVTR